MVTKADLETYERDGAVMIDTTLTGRRSWIGRRRRGIDRLEVPVLTRR